MASPQPLSNNAAPDSNAIAEIKTRRLTMGKPPNRAVGSLTLSHRSGFHFNTQQAQQSCADRLKTLLSGVSGARQIDSQLLGNLAVGQHDDPVGQQDCFVDV